MTHVWLTTMWLLLSRITMTCNDLYHRFCLHSYHEWSTSVTSSFEKSDHHHPLHLTAMDTPPPYARLPSRPQSHRFISQGRIPWAAPGDWESCFLSYFVVVVVVAAAVLLLVLVVLDIHFTTSLLLYSTSTTITTLLLPTATSTTMATTTTTDSRTGWRSWCWRCCRIFV